MGHWKHIFPISCLTFFWLQTCAPLSAANNDPEGNPASSSPRGRGDRRACSDQDISLTLTTGLLPLRERRGCLEHVSHSDAPSEVFPGGKQDKHQKRTLVSGCQVSTRRACGFTPVPVVPRAAQHPTTRARHCLPTPAPSSRLGRCCTAVSSRPLSQVPLTRAEGHALRRLPTQVSAPSTGGNRRDDSSRNGNPGRGDP